MHHFLAHRVRERLPRIMAPLLAAALLFVAPTAAEAGFTSTSTAALSASTYSIPAPASVNATYVCNPNGKLITITVAGYAKVPRATAYTFTVTAPDGTSSSTTTTQDAVVLTQTSANVGNRTYTLTVQAQLGTWTGSPLTVVHVC
ncbi:MAG: hypothetical protein HOQ07_03180 [Sinomonas sp.]|nr:hypothetical protein [Sinomonas sp.]